VPAAAATQIMSRRGFRTRLEIDRNRLGVTEQERRLQKNRSSRPGRQYGAERIDVLERIEADTAQAPGRIVAEQARHKAMGRFMEGDRDG